MKRYVLRVINSLTDECKIRNGCYICDTIMGVNDDRNFTKDINEAIIYSEKRDWYEISQAMIQCAIKFGIMLEAVEIEPISEISKKDPKLNKIEKIVISKLSEIDNSTPYEEYINTIKECKMLSDI